MEKKERLNLKELKYIKKEFDFSKEGILEYTGLDSLKPEEDKILKYLVYESKKENDRIENPDNKFYPGGEARVRFLRDVYQIDIHSDSLVEWEKLFPSDLTEDGSYKASDLTKRYFKSKQKKFSEKIKKASI